MKKLLLAVLALGIVFAGCAKKETVKSTDQSAVDKSVTEQTKPDSQKSIPVEAVKSDVSEKDISAESSAVMKLQAMMRDIHFDFDRYAVKSEDREILRENANILLKNPNLRVSIEGHCDERGTNEYNLALGDRRANAVRESMASHGISSAKMDTISYGEEKPLCKAGTEECWAKNRRAHFALSGGRP